MHGRAETSTTADDLDLFGRASLSCLLGPVFTPAGKRCLTRWLLEPAQSGEIERRQGAVAELAPQLDVRQEMIVRGGLLGDDPPDTDRFLRWVRTEPWLLKRRGFIWITRALPLLVLGLLLAHVSKAVAYPVWLVPLLVNIALTRVMAERIHKAFSEASLGERTFYHYAALFAIFDEMSAETEKLKSLKDATVRSHRSAYREMQRLNQIMHMADVRYSSMSHSLLQALTLWDFHVLFLLEQWQRTVGVEAEQWLAALGELEALASLASLSHDHPEWVYPTVATGDEPKFVASGLGHPLLHPETCVVNDVELGPPGTFLLVTGSNMSGKSTLLRAIGVNVTLGLAGGPVCARSMRLPRVVLGTSFRVRDSIEDGVSYFMAELQRLKDVIDHASVCSGETGCVLLYLLDEVLLGTNVRERQIAVQRVVRHLVELKTIGAVATHDLSLADAPLLSRTCRPAHFSERFADGPEGPVMIFDYVLRPGLSTTTNALKLLQMVGIDADTAGDSLSSA
jgi:DNA mismatch repair ATPase MutS